MDLKDLSTTVVGRARTALADLGRRVDPANDERIEPLRVGDLASGGIATVEGEVSLASVVRALVDNDVGVVVVMGPAGPAGIVSERDIIDAIYDGADLETIWAADVMETDLISVEPRMSAEAAAAIMVDNDVRHLLIEGDDPTIVSMRDIVAAQAHPVSP